MGGDALYTLANAKPAHQISCLVRDASKADKITQRFPSVRVVNGDLDDSNLLEHEAKNADIVFSTLPRALSVNSASSNALQPSNSC